MNATNPPTPDATTQPRAIVHRTRGQAHGPITRLMSPGDLGALLKPFVFLDRFEISSSAAPSMELGWHPHSGIATVSVLLNGAFRFAETTGKSGVVPEGGVEWMRAGGGVWHTGTVEPGGTRGFQLWVALPPDLEQAPSEGHYLRPDEVPTYGPARVILGAYEGVVSPIPAPPMTYLSIHLRDGERFTFVPPAGHEVAWVALMDGALRTPTQVSAGELVIFARGTGSIELVAEGDTRFVLGSAAPHPHDLVLGYYSVHSSAEALQRGEAEIRRIGAQLRAEGKQSGALRMFG